MKEAVFLIQNCAKWANKSDWQKPPNLTAKKIELAFYKSFYEKSDKSSGSETLYCVWHYCVHDVHFLSFINSQKQFHFLPAALLSSLGRVFIYSGSLCALLSSCSVFPKVQQKNNKFDQLVDKTDDLGRLIVLSRPDNLDCQNLKIFF